MNGAEEELICVGHVLGAHGIKGWVRVYSNTSPRENVVAYSPWRVEVGDELKTLAVDGRAQGKNILARLEGIENRDQAEALTGCKLYISHQQLPRLEAGEYYWSDLIGMRVESLAAEPLGTIESMLETGADDVMVLKGERERLIPFVIDDIVREVDLEGRRLVVDWSPEY